MQSGKLSWFTMRMDSSFLRSFSTALKEEQFKPSLSLCTLENVADPLWSYISNQKLPSGTAMVGIAKSTKGCANSKRGCQSCTKSTAANRNSCSQMEHPDNETLGNLFRESALGPKPTITLLASFKVSFFNNSLPEAFEIQNILNFFPEHPLSILPPQAKSMQERCSFRRVSTNPTF